MEVAPVIALISISVMLIAKQETTIELAHVTEIISISVKCELL